MDWRKPAVTQRACNGGLSPLQPGFNDGLSVEPMEVMFVKVKAAMRAAGNWPHAAAAVKYASWLEAQDREAAVARQAGRGGAPPSQAWLDSLSANEWPAVVAPALLEEAERRGPACFDHAFYIDSGYDLAFVWDDPDPAGLAWDQFLRMGLYEGRPYRFVC